MYFVFFFQAEDGIRDIGVTGVQTCALPIWADARVHHGGDRADSDRVRARARAAAASRRRRRLARVGWWRYAGERRVATAALARRTRRRRDRPRARAARG